MNELPQTILGYIIAAFLLLLKKIEYTQTIKGRKCYLSKSNYGVSLGYIVIYPARALYHELGHAEQSRRFGWFYLLIVGLPSLLRNIWARIFKKSREWYLSGWPENQAEEYAKERGSR